MSKYSPGRTYKVAHPDKYPPKDHTPFRYQSDYNDSKKYGKALTKNYNNYEDSLGSYDRDASKYLGSILQESMGNINREEDSILVYQNQENTLLREALIEKHNKLLVEIDTRNTLQQTIKQLEEKLSKADYSLNQLTQENQDLKQTLTRQREKLQRKNQEKCRSVQNRLQSQNARNAELKNEVDAMRAKLLEQKMVNNNQEELNNQLRQQLQAIDADIEAKIEMLRERDSHIQYLENQLEILNTSLHEKTDALKYLESQREDLNIALLQKTKAENQLGVELRREKQKYNNLYKELVSTKNQHQNILENMEKQFRQQAESLQKELQYERQSTREKEERHLQELRNLNILFKQKDRQLDTLRRKPYSDAQKKKKNFQRTKDLVNRLDSQQMEYQNGVKNHSGSKEPSAIKTHSGIKGGLRKTSKSPFGREKTPNTGGYRDIYISSGRISPSNKAPKGKKNKDYMEEKAKYLTTINNIQEMQMSLLNCNVERKKIKAQIERLEETAVQTRQVIGKRRKLEEELKYQESKIEKVKEQLRRMRAM